MKKTALLLLQATILSLSACTNKGAKSPSGKPNIVYILADDLGYGDISYLNSGSKIRTPNIDMLASEGISFTDAHSNASVCTPTRYGILTGEYCWRSRLKKGVLLGYSPSLIEEGAPTIAKFLRGQGYTTACIGKWHLGIDFRLKDGTYHKGVPDADFTPELIGFDEHEMIDFLQPAKGGPLGAGFDYSFILPASLDFGPYMYLENNLAVEAPLAFTPGNNLNAKPWASGAFWREGQMSPSFKFEGVLPSFTNQALRFIEKQKNGDKPFFLYFPMNAPHTPWVPVKEFIGSSETGGYGDFVQMVDAQVGKILKCLQENGLEGNTLVVFTSDNGAKWDQFFIDKYGHLSNYTFRGMKSDVWEGGHRIPFILKWPGHVKHKTISACTISLTDFFATIQDILKPGDKKPQDSFSFLPVLLGNETDSKRPPVVHHSGSGKFGIRCGDWKYIEGLGSGGFTKPVCPEIKAGDPRGQLYNLKSDPQEKENLYLSEPKKVNELTDMLKEVRGY